MFMVVLCSSPCFVILYLVSFLGLQSSRWGRGDWLLCFCCVLLSYGSSTWYCGMVCGNYVDFKWIWVVYFGNFVSPHQTHHSPIVPNRCIALSCQFLERLTTSIASNCTFNGKLLNHHSEFDPIRHQPLIYVHVPIAQINWFLSWFASGCSFSITL